MEESNNDKIIFNTLPNESDNDKETNDGIDELIILYYFTICSCPFIIVIIILLIYLPMFFIFGCMADYKKMMRVDKKNKVLKVYDKVLISCGCNHNIKSYYFTTIKKIRIYVYSTPDPKIGFSKLYFINCEIYSIDGQKEYLFSRVKYDKELFDRYVSFFKKYFDTEVEPIEMAKDMTAFDILIMNNPISNSNEYPEESEINTNKPDNNEGAALPVFS